MITNIWKSFVFLLVIKVANGNLCGDNSEVNTSKNISAQLRINPKAPETPESSKEYVFEAYDPKTFLTIKFRYFDIGGPDCAEEKSSTVVVETELDGVIVPAYTFCKGRRSLESISSMGNIKIGLCHRYATQKIEFTVSAGCDAELLVEEQEKIVKLKKSCISCSLILTSLRNGMEITFSEINTRKTKSNRCKGSFIAVTGREMSGSEQPILLGGKEKLCSVDGEEVLKSQYHIETEMLQTKIEYKNTAFTISFKEKISESYTIVARKIDIGTDAVTKKSQNTTTGIYVAGDYVGGGSGKPTNSTYIIALGCGGLFIIIVIIAALIFVKRRRSRSTTRKSKSISARQCSTKHSNVSLPANAAVTRTASIGSINNAMYDRVLSGEDTTRKKDHRPHVDSNRSRLADLEDKYGPFPETSDTFQQQTNRVEYNTRQNSSDISDSEGLLRRGTRPMLPPPPENVSCDVKNNQYKCERMSASPNLYESIGGISLHAINNSIPRYDQTRASFVTNTSDEFSDCEDYPRNVSYDPVPQDSNYASILDGPGVSYDTVDDCGTLPCQVVDTYTVSNEASRVNLWPTSSSTHKHYPMSRPSLPEIRIKHEYLDLNSERSCSIASSLQEDGQSYLQPRPSFPDAIVACAYSSTEDISDIRRRLIAAAHPCLLKNQDNSAISSSSEKLMYDSPRPSVGEIETTRFLKVQYASPRRPNRPKNP